MNVPHTVDVLKQTLIERSAYIWVFFGLLLLGIKANTTKKGKYAIERFRRSRFEIFDRNQVVSVNGRPLSVTL